MSPIPQSTSSVEPIENDLSMEDRFYSDGDMIEEERAMDEVMLLLDSPQCESVNYEEKEIDEDTFTEQETYIDEMSDICDNNARVMANTADYVDLIEANDDEDRCEQVDENEILFKDHSRKELINELLAARNRIKELEAKLGNIQKAHMSMLQNLNNFNKVLIS